jgi:carboxymethylenebutenolidase
MCYDDQAQPPVPPGSRVPAHGEDIVLTAPDGTRFAAYSATTEQPASAYVLIYPDVRGLHNFYKQLALRFAEVGIPALAIDYFGRTAGLTSRDDTFEFWPHVQQITLDTFTLDVQTAIQYIHSKSTPDVAVFVVGFCMGGSFTLLTGTDPGLGFAGLLPFYAGLTRDFGGRGTVLENAAQVVYPVLGMFGGADEGIPASAIETLDAQLDLAAVEHRLVVYPGAPHSFFDRRAEQYAEASADAWQQALSFIAAHSKSSR